MATRNKKDAGSGPRQGGSGLSAGSIPAVASKIHPFTQALMDDPIMREIEKHLSSKICVRMFSKTYRPEEQEKLAKADRILAFYKSRYPEKWVRFYELAEKHKRGEW